MIMDKCGDLLPDYFSFVKGLVDSADLNLNISRETLQQDHQVRIIAKAIDKKIKSELAKMLKNDREKYEDFFKTFGTNLKWGVYADYGMHKDGLKDLIMFKSSNGDGYTTLKEYVERMADSQDTIYYACGDSAEKIALLPQCEGVRAKGYEILYFTDEVAKVLSQMPGGNDNGVKAQLVLEINSEHPIAEKLKTTDEDTLKKYTNILYSQARLIAGLPIANPTELADSIVELM